MADRKWAGSWLAGTGAAGTTGPTGGGTYPGQRLGLPESGAGAVAGFGARFAALLIDWALSVLIGLSVVHPQQRSFTVFQLWTIAIFAAEVYVLTALTGFTVGKRLLRLRVQRMDGRPVGFGWAAVRTLLLLAVIPALITDSDKRGMHDRAANTVVTRL